MHIIERQVRNGRFTCHRHLFNTFVPIRANKSSTMNANAVNFELREDLVASLGLTRDGTSGKLGSEMLGTSLRLIADSTRHSMEQRTLVAEGICNWQSWTSETHRSDGFRRFHSAVFSSLTVMLTQSPHSSTTGIGNLDTLLPAKYLAEALHRQVQLQPIQEMGATAFVSFLSMLQTVVDRRNVQPDGTSSVCSSTFTFAMKLLVDCLPDSVSDKEQRNQAVTVVLRLIDTFSKAEDIRSAAAEKLRAITTAAGGAGCGTDAKWMEHASCVLSAIRDGHYGLKEVVLKNKAIFSARAHKLEDYLPDLLDCFALDELRALLQDVAECEPRKLVKSVSRFVKELQSAALQYQHFILGLLLSVAMAMGANPLLPVLDDINVVCSTAAGLFIPFFKLLTAVASSGGEDVALQCMVMVARIAKSGLVEAPLAQAAVLDSLNIIKDHCKYCNVFQAETLKVLEGCAAHNSAVYKNILTWNTGKAARRGDHKAFLLSAGSASRGTATVAAGPSLSPFRWFAGKKDSALVSPAVSPAALSSVATVGSPQRGDKTDAIRAAAAVGPSTPPPSRPFPAIVHSPPSGSVKPSTVMPSPQSQSLALLQQQLELQHQQLLQQMALVQQLQAQQQEQQLVHQLGGTNEEHKHP